jgi:hypothetical protein
MYSCSFCPRVICSDRCITLRAPEEILAGNNAHFICPQCHHDFDRYTSKSHTDKFPYTVCYANIIWVQY